MAKIPDVVLSLHFSDAKELTPGKVYLIRMPDDLPPQFVQALGEQLGEVTKQFDVKFVVVSPGLEVISPSDIKSLAEIPEFKKAVLDVINAHTAEVAQFCTGG